MSNKLALITGTVAARLIDETAARSAAAKVALEKELRRWINYVASETGLIGK